MAMGLDMLPLSKPKTGFECEFDQLFQSIFRKSQGATHGDRDATVARFQEITIAPYEVLGAPRVGEDNVADEWLETKLREMDGGITFDELKRRMTGYYVLDLVPPCDGLPVYTNCEMGLVEAYSFRGSFLADCDAVLDDETIGRAWTPMKAEELVAYGERLREKAARYAAEHGVSDVIGERRPDCDLDQPCGLAHIVDSAGRWCIFWGRRGFGLEPWY